MQFEFWLTHLNVPFLLFLHDKCFTFDVFRLHCIRTIIGQPNVPHVWGKSKIYFVSLLSLNYFIIKQASCLILISELASIYSHGSQNSQQIFEQPLRILMNLLSTLSIRLFGPAKLMTQNCIGYKVKQISVGGRRNLCPMCNCVIGVYVAINP